MRKTILILIFSIIPILTIYALHKIVYKDNIPHFEFNRVFKKNSFSLEKTISLEKKYVKIIGGISSNIYLYSEDLYSISRVNLPLKKEDIVVKVKDPIQTSNIFNNKIYTFSVNSNKFSVFNKDLNLLETKSISSKFHRGSFFKNISFYRLIDSTARGRFMLNKNNKNYLAQYNVSDTTTIDGGITTDGYFINDEESLLYVQYHMGKFYKLDSNNIKMFKMPYSFNSVNGFSRNGNTFSINRAIIARNKFSSIDGNNFYNASFVKSENQTLKEFTNKVVVDVYNLSNGNYVYSFYLPNYENKKPNDMIIKNNILYVLYANNLSKFKIEK